MALDRISLIGANFTSIILQQNTMDTTLGWSAPPYSQAFTLTRDYDQRLYRLSIPSNGNFTRRYTRIFIGTQATTDGGSAFELAGIHLGTFTAIPAGIAVNPGYRAGRARPFVRHEASLGNWRVAYPSGDTFATPSFGRFALKSRTTPGVGDDYATWLAIDRQIDAAPKGIFCLVLAWLGPGAVLMVRQENDHDWQDDGASVMRDSWDLVEASVG